ncbi:MAG: hypothetical protein CVU95_00895 [Firmicutes bacterium HGW-Firmicutes-2]|jgi:hypothetical protein|nr:MAG: hypothetical protein CVU95_00895 [Firmicutes bacterium HGW-Firmicutes-2]
MSQKINCPVCSESVDKYDICDNCGWQNSGSGESESDLRGPNEISLKEARQAFKKEKSIN